MGTISNPEMRFHIGGNRAWLPKSDPFFMHSDLDKVSWGHGGSALLFPNQN